MRRYWVDSSSIHSDQVTFTGDVFHHIFDVCRQETGHNFEVLTEDGSAHLVEVTSVDRKQAQAKIIESRKITPLAEPYINIALSVSRYHVMDAVVEKAVEMGVKKIQPFFSEYSFVRKAQNLPPSKKERWQKIVVSATQQSGRGDLMTIPDAIEWDDMLKEFNPKAGEICLFAYEGDSVLDIKTYLNEAKKRNNGLISNVWLIVGSEGGFSAQEVSKMKDLGLDPVGLGEQILRVETACMTLVSVLKYEFGLLK